MQKILIKYKGFRLYDDPSLICRKVEMMDRLNSYSNPVCWYFII